MSNEVLPRVLLAIGAFFLLANLRLLFQFLRYLKLRSSALLTWPVPRPRSHKLFLLMGPALGLLILVKIFFLRQPFVAIFGESMMLVYFAALLPLSLRISRGFYEDGVWADDGFMPYGTIGGMSWREGPELTLMLIPRMRRLARRLSVPRQYYGEARRLLRDKIAGHDIHFTGKPLDLGAHDERDDV